MKTDPISLVKASVSSSLQINNNVNVSYLSIYRCMHGLIVVCLFVCCDVCLFVLGLLILGLFVCVCMIGFGGNRG